MSGGEDWWVWPLVAAVVALLGWYFWHTATTIFSAARRLGETIQNWPCVRRAWTEAEVRRGGRDPFWLRAFRALLIVVMVIGALWLVLHRLFGVI